MCAAPSDTFAFDLDLARQAAENFQTRESEREAKAKAIEEGDYAGAEGHERVAKRINYLREAVKQAVAASARESVTEAVAPIADAAIAEAASSGAPIGPGLASSIMASLPPGLSELVQGGPVMPGEMSNATVERVLGETRNFLAVGFFDKGAAASRAVGRVVTKVGGGRFSYGTGFLVSPRLLMTNNHVLSSAQVAARSTVQFNYQISGGGGVLPLEEFALAPEDLFLTDRDLDFALVAVAPRSANKTPLASFGYLSMIAAEGKIFVRDPVNIVQHPKGDLKQIVIRQNTLLDLPEKAPLDKYAHYEADTEPGSSGSPVFNDQWEVVALHHSSVPKMNAHSQILDRKGNVWQQGGNQDDIDWVANEGIRTSRLVKCISAAALTGTAKKLQDEFVAISSGVVPPPAVAVAPPPLALQAGELLGATGAATGGGPDPSAAGALGLAGSRPAAAAEAMAAGAAAAPSPGSGVVTVSIPLTVTLTVGLPGANVAAAVSVQPAAAPQTEKA